MSAHLNYLSESEHESMACLIHLIKMSLKMSLNVWKSSPSSSSREGIVVGLGTLTEWVWGVAVLRMARLVDLILVNGAFTLNLIIKLEGCRSCQLYGINISICTSSISSVYFLSVNRVLSTFCLLIWLILMRINSDLNGHILFLWIYSFSPVLPKYSR